MTVHFYTDGNPVHDRVILAMYNGCPERDKQLRKITNYAPSHIAVMFGMYKAAIPVSWPRGIVMAGQRQFGWDVIVIDSGYVHRGDGPNNFYSVGFDGLNGRADFRNINMPPDRWQALGVELKPYRRDGEHILLCGQVPWDASVQTTDLQAWMRDTVDSLREHTDRPIIYRSHPNAYTRAPMRAGQSDNVDLASDLKNAWAVVTYNSNTGVDAAIAGYPVYVGDVGSMAWPIAAGFGGSYANIENPPLKNRKQWAADLAYTQWTIEEMTEGETWNHLTRHDESSSATTHARQ